MSFLPCLPSLISLAKPCCLDKHPSYLICSDNESGGRTPLSKEITQEQPLIVAPSEDPVIDISDSPKNKRKSAEDAEPSSPKKRKVARKSRAAATKLTDTDNFDDYVDNMDLDASDDVSFQRLYSFPSVLDLLLETPKPSCSVLFAYCCSFCLAACHEESSFDCL